MTMYAVRKIILEIVFFAASSGSLPRLYLLPATSLNQFLLLPETGGLTLKDRLMALEAQESTRPPRTRPVPPQEPDEKVRLVAI